MATLFQRRRRRERLISHPSAPQRDLASLLQDQTRSGYPIGQRGAAQLFAANPSWLPPRELQRLRQFLDDVLPQGMGRRQSPITLLSYRKRPGGSSLPTQFRGTLPPASYPVGAVWKAANVAPISRSTRVCFNRSRRREVLHALGIAGRRGLRGAGGSYHRRPSSELSCR